MDTYKKSTYSKPRAAFHNVQRRILKLPWRSSASAIYTLNGIQSTEILIRKRIVGFIDKARISTIQL